jgi:lipopolysaccharide export system ATP-binding protein
MRNLSSFGVFAPQDDVNGDPLATRQSVLTRHSSLVTRNSDTIPPRTMADHDHTVLPFHPDREKAETLRLAATGLEKVYRGRKVVRGVSVDIRQGEIVGLLGPNGAGKTTTFYMIVGLVRPDGGKVTLGSHDITQLPMYLRAQRGISYLPQEPSVFRKLTVEENLLSVFETMSLPLAERERRTRALLEEFGITHIARNRAYSLSGGERRRVEIARSLAINPAFILLDEPFAGIDPIAVFEIQRIVSQLRARGIGILITDHNVRETLKITDRAYIIKEGEIFRQGVPEELSADAEVRRIYLGESFNLN